MLTKSDSTRREWLLATGVACAWGCAQPAETESAEESDLAENPRFDIYTPFRLETDLSALSEKDRQMLPLLVDAAKIMDEIFWRQAWGEPQTPPPGDHSEKALQFFEMNYGPWDRLDDNKPFLPGVGPKPDGVTFYPEDMTKEEFEAAADESFRSLYTVVRRDDAGKLQAVPYHEVFADQLGMAAEKLREAATLAEDAGLKKYLELRAEALVTDKYQPSDFAWMDMKSNTIDVVIGAIENYEDELFGYKAAYEAYVLIKDQDWSARLGKYAAMLPDLQRGLPVPDAYKRENPGTDSDLNVYDAIYYAGDCNAGAKTIAINLPNDEEVQLKSGSRRLQLKNSMQAKFDKILVPIAGVLIAEDQRDHVNFDSFFANTMFHEVAHGLGIKETINDRGTAREALKEHYSALEEGKADILGLYMVTKLHEMGDLEGELEDYYVTFLAGIFRSVRFGASSAHGVANMLRFYFFQQEGAFSHDAESGTYRVEMEKMQDAVAKLSEKILKIQGDGDYDGAAQFISEMGQMGAELQVDLDRVNAAGIPVDIVFEQGQI